MITHGLGIWRAALVCAWVVGFAACGSGNGIVPGTADGGPGGDAGAAGSDVDAGGNPPMGGGGLGCDAQCCPMPHLADSCTAADQGKTCPSSETCSGGLILPEPLECDGGTWTTQENCGDAGTATNGCPTSQPTNGTACNLPDGSWCQYALVCPSTCDAGTAPTDGGTGTGCATASKVGPAHCNSGVWDTTPLGTCP